MKAISSKINTQIRNVNIINNNIEKIALRFMLWSFAALAVWYVFLLGSMVFNIVERRNLEKEALTISSQVSDLESTYLSLSNHIDLDYSHSLGFKETNVTFATRKALGYLPSDESSSSIKTAKNEI